MLIHLERNTHLNPYLTINWMQNCFVFFFKLKSREAKNDWNKNFNSRGKSDNFSLNRPKLFSLRVKHIANKYKFYLFFFVLRSIKNLCHWIYMSNDENSTSFCFSHFQWHQPIQFCFEFQVKNRIYRETIRKCFP